ncbi:MAG: hypothetical protein KJ050_11715 [Candidatus Omnitrophica bacterium]|nr:hypothetical protein [bacterium]MBW7937649.1 hypothetical protein [Candidatus Omnitrophota bacterium]MCE7908577.1 hypothetical protein [Candidatus Omnitrophica bacterium COP1]MBV6483463.1 hypothetical protein [bacterium]MCK6495272.1 hypothetical protein [bacterium]
MSTPIACLYTPADLDPTSVEMLADNPALFSFRVILSGTPDPLWVRTFDRIWKESRYLDKLSAGIQGDSIRFICHQKQGIEDYLFLIESRIEATNRIMERYWQELGVTAERLLYRHFPESFIPIASLGMKG